MNKSRRSLFTILFTLIFLIAAPAIVLYALGYRINQGSSVSVSPTGGVSVRVPQKVKVSLDGKYLEQTPVYRSGIQTGRHTVSLEKNGFQPWGKTLKFTPYVVTEIEDTLLFPNNITTTEFFSKDTETVTDVYSSPRYASFVFTTHSSSEEKSESPSRNLYLYQPQEKRQTLLTDQDLPSAPVENIIWGQTNEQFLVTFAATSQNGKQTFLVTNLSQNTPTIKNVTSFFPYDRATTPITYITLTNNIITLQQGGHMFEINLLNETTSSPIVSNVKILKATPSRIVYLNKEQEALITFPRGDKENSTILSTDLPNNINKLYISPQEKVYVRANSTEIYTMTENSSESPQLSKLDLPARTLKFSQNGAKSIFATENQIAVRYTKDIKNYADRKKGETSVLYQSEDTTIDDIQWLPVSEAHILFRENNSYSVVELDDRGEEGASSFSLLEGEHLIPYVDGRTLTFFVLKNNTLKKGSFPIQREGLFQL